MDFHVACPMSDIKFKVGSRCSGDLTKLMSSDGKKTGMGEKEGGEVVR
jgi:hypothetical protein